MNAAAREYDALAAPLDGWHLVEANAGAGKTHAIIVVALRLLFERELAPRKLALVTFTNAAAVELRERLRQRVATLAALLDGREPADEPGADLHELARRVRTRFGPDASSRAREVALALDEALVGTLHHLCRRLLESFGGLAGCLVPSADPVSGEAARLHAMKDWWRRAVIGGASARARWIAAWAGGPERLADWLRETWSLPEHALDVPDATQVAADSTWLSALRDRIASVYAPGLAESAIAALGTLRRKDRPVSALREADAEIAAWLGAGDPSLPPLAALARFTTTALAELPDRRSREGRAWQPPALALSALLDAELDAARQAIDRLRARVLAEARAAVLEALAARRRDQDWWSHDDVIEELARALEGPYGERLARRAGAALGAVVIDEFQDTDARQYGIVQRLMQGRGNCLVLLMGDPKQAIYRFRGGDVYAYALAARDASQRWTLTGNWRSDPALIAAVNACFARPGRADPFGLAFIAHAPSQMPEARRAVWQPRPWSSDAPLEIWHFAVDRSDKSASRARLERLAIARAVAEIAELRRVHGPDRPRIAVLAATHRQCEAIAAALSGAGIAVALRRQGSVLAQPLVADLVALLEALAPESDLEAFRAALALPLLAEPLAALRLALDDERAAAGCLALRERWRALLEADGPMALARAIAVERSPRWLGTVDGEARLTDLLHLGELLEQAAASGEQRDGLGAWLSRRAASPDAIEDEATACRHVAPPGAVEVMTVHGSKGLEFDIVFAPLLWGRWAPKPGDHAPAKYHDDDGHLRIDLGLELEQHRQRQAIEEADEAVRRAYVALTRARQRCYVACGPLDDPDAAPLARVFDASDNATDTSAALSALAAAASGAIRIVTAGETLVPAASGAPAVGSLAARPFTRVLTAAPRLLSFTRLAGRAGHAVADHDQASGAERAAPDEPGPVAMWPRGAAAGIALHEALEHIDFARWPDAAERRLLDDACQRNGLGAAARETLSDWIDRLLATELLPGLRLPALSHAAQGRELGFHFRLGAGGAAAVRRALASEPRHARRDDELASLPRVLSGHLQGYIDLIVRHGEAWHVVDYKSNYLGTDYVDYAPAALASAVRAADYDLQYLIYLVALHRQLALRLGRAYDPERHLGGAIYVFVRGLDDHGATGIHVDRPPVALIESLSAAFDGRESA